MKIRLTLLFALIILFGSCSSMPKGERLQAVNAQKDQAVLYLQRGNNEYTWNNFDSALHQYKNAFTHASSVDWIDGMVRSLVQMSRSSDRIKAFTTARVYLDQVADLVGDTESRELALLVVNRETEWLLFNDSPASALRLNDQVITGIKDIRAEEAGEAWRIRGAVFKTMREYDNALQAIDNALEIDKKGNFISELASDYYIQASVLSLSGREVEAIDSMSRALEKDKFIENTPGIAQDLYGLGLIYEKTGENEKAYHYFQRSYLVQEGAGRSELSKKLLNKLETLESGSPWAMESDAF